MGWRVDWMKKFRTKSTKKKVMAGLVGMVFLGAGAISSVKASGYFAGLYEDAVREHVVAQENSVMEEDFGECSEEFYTTEPLSGDVVLMEGTFSKSVYGYEWTIPSNKTFRTQEGYYKSVGQSLEVTVNIKPTDHATNVGIVQPDGTRRYVEGRGVFGHTFAIKQTGTHYIYVENPSSGTIDVSLLVTY